MDVFFTFAPPAVLDALLPLQFKYCYNLVCALVPRTFFTRTNTLRAQWLATLQRHRLVRFVPVPTEPPSIWLLLAKKASVFGNVDAATFARTNLPSQV